MAEFEPDCKIPFTFVFSLGYSKIKVTSLKGTKNTSGKKKSQKSSP